MANLQVIRRRIASVKSTQKITRAMKMVAAAKLRRAQEAIMHARPYAYHMRDLTNGLAIRADRESHPLLSPGIGDKVGIVVVTSDRGLCGSFNTNIVNETMQLLRERFKGRQVELTVIGRKGLDALRRRPCTIRTSHVGVYDKFSINAASRIIDDVVAEFTKGETGEIHCLYNEFKSAIAQRVTLEKLLPYETPGQQAVDSATPGPSGGAPLEINYIYEPNERKILLALLVQNIHVQMYRILLESMASEQGARMTAMDSATKNAGDVIARLTLKYNRARQDAITREVIEVVSGAQ